MLPVSGYARLLRCHILQLFVDPEVFPGQVGSLTSIVGLPYGRSTERNPGSILTIISFCPARASLHPFASLH